MEGSPFCAGCRVSWPHSQVMGWLDQAGKWPPCLSGSLSSQVWHFLGRWRWFLKWHRMSGNWHQAAGRETWLIHNGKNSVPYSPFVSRTSEGWGRRHTTVIFTLIAGTSQKAGQITRPRLFPCTFAQRKLTLKHSWKKAAIEAHFPFPKCLFTPRASFGFPLAGVC